MKIFTLLTVVTNKNAKVETIDVKLFERKVDATSYLRKIRKSYASANPKETVVSYGWKYKYEFPDSIFPDGRIVTFEIKSREVIDYVIDGEIVKDAYLRVPGLGNGARTIGSGWF